MSGDRAGQRANHLRRRGWWASLAESIDSRLWPVPLAAVIIAVALGIFLPRVDVLVDSSLPTAVDSAVFNGGADTARSVLSSIAGSLITATSLTFSLTVIALQLASSQASPRVLRLFARDRQVHWTLAAFLGTFAYSITVLRSVRSATEQTPEVVPRISVTLAFVFTLVSVIMLVFFLAHLAAQLRVETMLKDIHSDTDRTIDLVSERNAAASAFPHRIRTPPTRQTVTSSASGFITGHDDDLLLRTAAQHEIVIQETRRIGENIVEGTPLAFWWRPGDSEGPHDLAGIEMAIREAYSIGYERTASEDIDYGVQQILDIGLRALSAGVNDPTTAVHALGHLCAITARTVNMPRFPAARAGEDGELRVVTVSRSVADDVDAALSPIRHYGIEHPAVVTRFVNVVDELSYLADHPDVYPALMAQLDALTQELRSSSGDPAATGRILEFVAEAETRIQQKIDKSPA